MDMHASEQSAYALFLKIPLKQWSAMPALTTLSAGGDDATESARCPRVAEVNGVTPEEIRKSIKSTRVPDSFSPSHVLGSQRASERPSKQNEQTARRERTTVNFTPFPIPMRLVQWTRREYKTWLKGIETKLRSNEKTRTPWYQYQMHDVYTCIQNWNESI